MSDEIQVENKEPEVDYKALYEKTQEDLQKVVAKKDELLTETKKVKKEREDQLAMFAKAEQEKAQKDGEFEKLWQTAEQQRKNLEQELQSERNSYKQEKIQSHAMKLAVELADGDALSAKLLSRFLTESISKMADERGSLDNDVLQAVKKEFQNNTDYAPLLSGSKANGGGALGSGNGVAKAKEITRSDFEQLDQAARGKFFASGGKLTD
jgi:hypothetical protein